MAQLIMLCPACDSPLYVRDGADRAEVSCSRCSWVRGGSDYLAACLGGATMGGGQPTHAGLEPLAKHLVDVIIHGDVDSTDVEILGNLDKLTNMLSEEGYWRLAIAATVLDEVRRFRR